MSSPKINLTWCRILQYKALLKKNKSINNYCCSGYNHFNFRHYASAKGKRSSTYYYEVLGLKSSATQSQIKTAYYSLSKKHHPDVSSKPESQEKFAEISQAYQILGDMKKRRLYDKGLGQHQSVSAAGNAGSDINFDDLQNRDDARPSAHFHDASKFDEFYQQHYNDIRKRRHKEYQDYKQHSQNQRSRQTKSAWSGQSVMSLILFSMVLTVLIRSV